MHVGFMPYGSASWIGGVSYTRNLLSALLTSNTRSMTRTLFVQEHTPDEAYRPLESLVNSIVTYPKALPLKRRSRHPIFHHLFYRCFYKRPVESVLREKFFRQRGVNVVFGNDIPREFNFPAVGWIPDFQHLHYPEIVSDEEYQKRNRKNKRLIERVTRIILSSNDALSDFRDFSPEYVDKAHVMHFVVPVPDSIYCSDPGPICDRYNLPAKYIYLPNQFWKHKNHQTAFEAVRILKSRGINVFLVCTGNPNDSRNPKYFAELIPMLSTGNIRDRVALLGLIPHNDIFKLMRQSVCMLNPSLFEGWSTTVEEAKSLGKTITLSNINVHKEQNPKGGRYFDPHDPEELANVLEELWKYGEPGPDRELEQSARSSQVERIEQFATRFVDIIKPAIHGN